MNGGRQIRVLGSPFQMECREVGGVQQKGIRMVKGQEQRSLGKEVKGTGLAQSGKEEVTISCCLPAVSRANSKIMEPKSFHSIKLYDKKVSKSGSAAIHTVQ